MDTPMQYEALPAETTLRLRLDFAQRCFTNVQELNRFMDQKAGYLISAVALMTAALGILAARALDVQGNSDLHVIVHTGALLFFFAYVIIGSLVIYNATSVFRALGSLLRPSTTAPGLMFPLILLDRVKGDINADERIYYDKLSSVTVEGILQDYANQIVEISAIYQRKQQRINRSSSLFGWLTVCWIISMVLLVATMILV